MRKIWVKTPGPLKLTAEEKTAILERVRNLIIASKPLAPVTSRVDVHNGRVFLYFLHQPSTLGQPGTKYTTPLIEEKYLEDCYARITLFTADGSECSADWQRQPGEWVTAREDSLEKCLKYIEVNDHFQGVFTKLNVKRIHK